MTSLLKVMLTVEKRMNPTAAFHHFVYVSFPCILWYTNRLKKRMIQQLSVILYIPFPCILWYKPITNKIAV